MEQYSRQADLLGRNHIETDRDLSVYTAQLSAAFKRLAIERKKFRNVLRRMRDSQTMQPMKDQISDISDRMAKLRKEMKLCEDIAKRCSAVECIVNTIEMPDKARNREKDR